MPMNVSSNLSAMQALHDLSSVGTSSASAAMAAARARIQATQDQVSKLNSAVSVDFSAGSRERFASLQASNEFSIAAGAMVDADMAGESTRLQALQTQQQLGTQALSIANQAPQALLSLFRG